MKRRRAEPIQIGELSPLSRKVLVEGVSLEIEIYRESKSRWGLQVLNGPVTNSWNRTFRSQRAALDDALRVLTDEGVEGFRMEDLPWTVGQG